MLDSKLINELNAPQHTLFHQSLLNHCLRLADMSRGHMSSFYSKWDMAQEAYKAIQNLDANDRRAIAEGRPTRQKVPVVYSKIQTFKSLLLALYFQRPRFYELEADGEEDQEYRELAEILLNRDLSGNKWFNLIAQWAGHIGKYGVGIIKHSWEEEFAYVKSDITKPSFSFLGVSLGSKTETQITQVPKRMGNRFNIVSPYHFLPDPRFPLSQHEQGEFCGDEMDMSQSKLLQLEAENVVAGMAFVPVLSLSRASIRSDWGATRRSQIDYVNPRNTPQLVRITNLQVKLTPSKFTLADGTPLGPETYPLKYLVWIANDQRIIRLEPMGYCHDSFTYDIAQFDEDELSYVSNSLTELISPIQDTSDWFLNTRVENVSKSLEDKMIVDPIGVDMETVRNRSRVILMKKGASRGGVDKYIKQLDVRDVTAGHMNDVNALAQIINSVSGINDNSQGQYASGRRSATEARVVTQGGAARTKMIAQVAWSGCLAPLGMKALLNLRQGLTPELITAYAGRKYGPVQQPTGQVDPQGQPMMQEVPNPIQVAFTSTPSELVRNTDFFIYEGTLQSEKSYTAQTLMELFQTLVGLGPSGLVNLNMSPKLLIERIYELLGMGSLAGFDLTNDPQTLQNVVQQLVQQGVQEQLANMTNAGPPANQ